MTGRWRRAAAILVAAVTGTCTASPATPPERWTESTTGMAFVRVPAGRFTMGSPVSEPGHQGDETLHVVEVRSAFYLGVHEVTRAQWSAVTRRSPAPSLAEGALPVVNVTWIEIQEFLDRLSRTAGRRVRLPTEAEWEYACRAGSTAAYATGPTLSTAAANYNGTFPLPGQSPGVNRGAVTPVGTFAPNRWGLADMHGNVWEWTADAYCPYSGDAHDPQPSCMGPLKVIRGGSWRFNADSARCALRYTHRPQDRGDSLGFRVAADVATEERALQ